MLLFIYDFTNSFAHFVDQIQEVLNGVVLFDKTDVHCVHKVGHKPKKQHPHKILQPIALVTKPSSQGKRRPAQHRKSGLKCNLAEERFPPLPKRCYDIGKLFRRARASSHSLLGAIFVLPWKTFIHHPPTLTAPNKPTTPIHLHPSTHLHSHPSLSLSPCATLADQYW